MRRWRSAAHLVLLAAWAVACGRSPLLVTDNVSVDAGAVRDSAAERDTTARELPPSSASCVPGPSVPTSLAVLDDFGGVLGMALIGDLVWVGGLADQPIEKTPRGRLIAVAVRDGAATKYDADNEIPQSLQATAPALVYTAGPPQPIGDNWRLDATRVVRWNLQTGEQLELAPPALFPSLDSADFATNTKGQVFWIATGSQGEAIAFWDPLTRATSLATAASNLIAVLADESRVYWKGLDNAGHVAFSSAPITGGPPSTLYTWVSPSPADDPDLLGIDDVNLYCASPNQPSLLALPKNGSSPGRVVIPDIMVGDAGLRIDETHFYWAHGSDGISIRRAAKSNGRAETLSSLSGRFVQALAIDDCNVYWVVANPFEIFYRSK